VPRFQDSAPGSYKQHKTIPSNNTQKDIIEKCGMLTNFPAVEEVWYSYDDIRNRARTDAHNTGTRNRLITLLHTTKTTNEMNYMSPPSNVDIIKTIRRVDDICKQSDPGIWTILDMISGWMAEQLEWNTCLTLTIEGASLSERSSVAVFGMVNILCGLGYWMLPNEGGADLEEGLTQVDILHTSHYCYHCYYYCYYYCSHGYCHYHCCSSSLYYEDIFAWVMRVCCCWCVAGGCGCELAAALFHHEATPLRRLPHRVSQDLGSQATETRQTEVRQGCWAGGRAREGVSGKGRRAAHKQNG
jgi:hypothetical protein